jgi:transposase, IS30 family
MKRYKQLTVAQRSKIEVLHLKKYSLTDIALTIGVDKSTVSREIKKRSTPNGYFADIAQIDYEDKRENSGRTKILTNKKKLNYVISKLHKGWSPETISGRLKFKNANWNISKETIYQFIYEDDYCKQENLYQYLKQGKRRRTKWKGRKTKKDRIPNRVSIHERPAIVSYHVEFGHWEGDSVIYPNKKAINTLNELKTGYLEFSVLERKTAKLTAKAMIEKLSKHESKTLTVDNGSEFTRHEIVTEATGVSVYFADPYASYQRGSNENSNGLLRRYLPKRKNIDKLAQEELDEIAADLNNRPRKRLGFMTPAEAYQLEINNILSNVALEPRM